MSRSRLDSRIVRQFRARIGIGEKYAAILFPLAAMSLFFVVPLVMLFVFSFYQNIDGGYFVRGFVLENWVRLIDRPLYRGRMVFTFQISIVTALLCLVVGYPLALYLANLQRRLFRRALLTLIISTLWLTWIVRGYVWSILLQRTGLIPQMASAVGVIDEPVSLVPGYWALVVGMVYVFLPFMILTLYANLRKINDALVEASRDLGAGPVTTFYRVTLPLSKNGIVSGTLLVFILSLGVFVLPQILGSASEWTIAVLIANQVGNELNIPFAAVLSITLLASALAFLGAINRLLGLKLREVLGGVEYE